MRVSVKSPRANKARGWSHDKKFSGLVLQVLHDVVVRSLAQDVRKLMPSTGLPPFLELIVDGGTIGIYSNRSTWPPFWVPDPQSTVGDCQLSHLPAPLGETVANQVF